MRTMHRVDGVVTFDNGNPVRPEFDGDVRDSQGLQWQIDKSGRGVLCFTWDDNYADWLTEVTPYTANQRHTFFIQTNQIDQPGHLTSEQILGLFNDGHEIGSHSVTHQMMASLTPAQRQPEWDDSKATLEAIVGAGNVTSFAYPSSSYTADINAEGLGRYQRLCRVDGTFMVPASGSVKPRIIGRRNWGATNTAEIKQWVRYAKNNDVIVVILNHDPGATNYPTLAETAEVLTLAHTLGVPCMRLDEVFPSIDTVPNSSFESGLDGWTVTATGAGAATTVTDTPDAGLHGTKSAKLTTSSNTDTVNIQTTVPVETGKGTWALQIRARVLISDPGTGGVTVEVEERSAVGGILATSVSSNITSTSWTKVSRTFVPNAATAFAHVRLKVSNCTAQAWFDHAAIAPTNDVYG